MGVSFELLGIEGVAVAIVSAGYLQEIAKYISLREWLSLLSFFVKKNFKKHLL